MWELVILMNSALGSSGELSRESAELVGRMCREVALTYFMECRCFVVVTEVSKWVRGNRSVDYMHPFELSMFLIPGATTGYGSV
jgi:hypothetical protein